MSDFPGKILLATDRSEDSTVAARAAIELANDTGAELHVVHVGESHLVHPPPTAGGPLCPCPPRMKSVRWPRACSTISYRR
jgi:hypothetical protein